MLQYMLRSHPRLSLPTGESHFILPLQKDAERYGDLNRQENVRLVLERMCQQSQEFLETDLHGLHLDAMHLSADLHGAGCNSIPKIIDGLFTRNAIGEGKARWGDKTPYYVLHLSTLVQMFPDAQIIHLVRDGRDVALSLFGRRLDFHVYNTYFAAKYWQHYVDVGHTTGVTLEPEVYLEVRYEDLLSNPTTAVERICSFLGEEFSDAVINFKKAGQAGKTPLVQKPLQATNIEKWRRKMTKWQVRVFESAAGETLARHGYPLVTSARPLLLPLRATYRMHNLVVDWYYRKFGQSSAHG